MIQVLIQVEMDGETHTTTQEVNTPELVPEVAQQLAEEWLYGCLCGDPATAWED